MNSNKLTVKDSSLSFFITFILCQFGVIIISSIALIVCRFCGVGVNDFSHLASTAVGYLISAVGMYLIMFCSFLFFNKNKENEITAKVKSKKLLIYILIAIASFLLLYPIIACIDSLLVRYGVGASNLPFPLTTKNYFISLLPLVIAPAICEELLFRGLIFKGLKKHGKIFSILISAIMFCIYHMSVGQTVYPILMGLLLGVIMYYEDNIYYCIAVHITNNFLTLTLSYFKINLIFNHWSYIILAITLCFLFISVVISLIIKNNKSNEKQSLVKQEKIYLFISLAIMLSFWILINFA